MSNKPTIQILAERLIEAKGTDYYITGMALAMYVHNLSDVDFLGEIMKVTNPKIFGVLWSVGLTRYQQGVVSQRAEELE